jgi:hypothetical protein
MDLGECSALTLAQIVQRVSDAQEKVKILGTKRGLGAVLMTPLIFARIASSDSWPASLKRGRPAARVCVTVGGA